MHIIHHINAFSRFGKNLSSKQKRGDSVVIFTASNDLAVAYFWVSNVFLWYSLYIQWAKNVDKGSQSIHFMWVCVERDFGPLSQRFSYKR